MLHRRRVSRSFQDFSSAPASASQLLKVKLAGRFRGPPRLAAFGRSYITAQCTRRGSAPHEWQRGDERELWAPCGAKSETRTHERHRPSATSCEAPSVRRRLVVDDDEADDLAVAQPKVARQDQLLWQIGGTWGRSVKCVRSSLRSASLPQAPPAASIPTPSSRKRAGTPPCLFPARAPCVQSVV